MKILWIPIIVLGVLAGINEPWAVLKILLTIVGVILFFTLAVLSYTPSYLRDEEDERKKAKSSSNRISKYLIKARRSLEGEDKDEAFKIVEDLLNKIANDRNKYLEENNKQRFEIISNRYWDSLKIDFAKIICFIASPNGIDNFSYARNVFSIFVEKYHIYEAGLVREIISESRDKDFPVALFDFFPEVNEDKYDLDIVIGIIKSQPSKLLSVLDERFSNKTLSISDVTTMLEKFGENEKYKSWLFHKLINQGEFSESLVTYHLLSQNFNNELALDVLKLQLENSKIYNDLDSIIGFWWLHRWRFCDHDEALQIIENWLKSISQDKQFQSKVELLFCEEGQYLIPESVNLRFEPDSLVTKNDEIKASLSDFLEQAESTIEVKIILDTQFRGSESGELHASDDFTNNEEFDLDITFDLQINCYEMIFDFNNRDGYEDLINFLEKIINHDVYEEISSNWDTDGDYDVYYIWDRDYFRQMTFFSDGKNYLLLPMFDFDPFLKDSDSLYLIPLDENYNATLKKCDPIMLVNYETGIVGANIGGEPISDRLDFDEFDIDLSGNVKIEFSSKDKCEFQFSCSDLSGLDEIIETLRVKFNIPDQS
jgi:hypothetical protein